jgi:hypothetical protein
MFALLLLIPSLALAATKPITVVQKLGPGRQLHVQIAKPEAGKPTFLFLPGVNRGLLLEEPAAAELIKNGNGVVGFNFSVQPISLATLPRGEKPAFYSEEVTLESLAAEAEGVAKALASQYGIKNLVPVTLSYTGAVSAKLKFSRIVDSVPLTSMAAFSPELAQYRNWLKSGELFNPIFGPGITRASLDAAYRMQWSKQVDAITQQFSLPRDRSNEMIDGYIRLSRATEGFEWSNKADRAQRTFILAANESPALLRHQAEVVRERLARNSGESVFIVQESGHVIPAEQPKAYARILELVASGLAKANITLVTPSTGEMKTLTKEESIRLLDKALKDLPAAPSGSSSSAPKGDRVPGTL